MTGAPIRHAPLATAGWPDLPKGRIASIDVFRALTVLLMITVNEWHAVAGLPAWMKHMPADADAMSFVDMVFPAFLFIVGMSLPFALMQRMARAASWQQVLGHVLLRGGGLVLIGVFMVNSESGYHQPSMPMPIAAWALLMYGAAYLVWGSWQGAALPLGWRAAGVTLFLVLAALYRGGEHGEAAMQPQWWGILGLIGWAYLLGVGGYLLSRARLAGLVCCVALGLGFYALAHWRGETMGGWEAMLWAQQGHASHAVLVWCGAITALLWFHPSHRDRAWRNTLMLAAVLALLAVASHQVFPVSKIHATPPWALYCAASFMVIFPGLQALIQRVGDPAWLRPVAAHPLVAYLIPFVLGSLTALLQWQGPDVLRHGVIGVLWGVLYALLVAVAVRWLSARRFGLRI